MCFSFQVPEHLSPVRVPRRARAPRRDIFHVTDLSAAGVGPTGSQIEKTKNQSSVPEFDKQLEERTI
jgi:hypothetical protein